MPEPTAHLLTRPIVVAAVLTLAFNDQIGKPRWSGSVTGIASDVAGLALLPVLLVAGIELLQRRTLAVPATAIVAGAVAAGFAAVELLPAAESAWRYGLGVLGAPLRWSFGERWSTAPVVATQDPFDLAALPAAALVVVVRKTSGTRTTNCVA